MVREVVDAAEAWLLRDTAWEFDEFQSMGDWWMPPDAASPAAIDAHSAAREVGKIQDMDLSRATGVLVRAADATGEAAVIETVREELVSWTLGYGDPVAERVAARMNVDRGSGTSRNP